MPEGKLVKNASQGYGYSYSSLADLHKAGIAIPKMKTMIVEGVEYVFYWDEKSEKWEQGAKVVVPAMRGSNEAQAYGAGLTYARRYTVQLAQSVACDDDVAVENARPVARKVMSVSQRESAMETDSNSATSHRWQIFKFGKLGYDFDKMTADIHDSCDTIEQLTYEYERLVNETKPSSKQDEIIKRIFEKRKEEILGKR